jgi:Flp pilus assembly protein TadG
VSNTLPFYRFKHADEGATAVEFALVAPIFLLIIFAIFEVSLMFFASVNLDGAAIEAARRIRTGQSQHSADPLVDFKSSLCSQLDTMINCNALFYDARVMNTYSSISLATEYDPVTGEPITYGFSAGTSGDIVVVRLMYTWTINTPMVGAFFENTPGTSKRLLASTVVFQNEPYE